MKAARLLVVSREELMASSVDGEEVRAGLGKCRVWVRAKHEHGYGQRYISERKYYAHRLAYEAFVGPIPDGLHVLHKCDNPPCIRSDHLFLGTHLDNIADMVAKGRSVAPRGERHPRAKLTEDQVRAIRVDARTHRAIAKDYGVDHSQITRIKCGKIWRKTEQCKTAP